MKKNTLIFFLITTSLFAQEKTFINTKNNHFKIKEQNEHLVVEHKTYEKKYILQSEKLWKRWNIPIIKVYINNKGETTLIYKHPITKTIHKTSIRKKNVEKIKRESINNKKEIIIENKKGKFFF